MKIQNDELIDGVITITPLEDIKDYHTQFLYQKMSNKMFALSRKEDTKMTVEEAFMLFKAILKHGEKDYTESYFHITAQTDWKPFEGNTFIVRGVKATIMKGEVMIQLENLHNLTDDEQRQNEIIQKTTEILLAAGSNIDEINDKRSNDET